MQKRFGTGTMLIPRPLDVDAIMRRAKKGKLVTQAQIREKLAGEAGADSACPMTTGMFIRIAAKRRRRTFERAGSGSRRIGE